MNRRTSWADRILIVMFMACLVAPLVMTRTTQVSIPKIPLLKPLNQQNTGIFNIRKLPQEFEEFFGEHFGFRKELIRLNQLLMILYRDNSGKNVIIGKNHWLYYGDESVVSDITGKRMFTASELKQWERYMKIKAAALRDLGIPYLCVIAPNKHMIYPDNLPDRYRPEADGTRTDQWLEHFRSIDGFPLLDIRDDLRQAASIMPVFNPLDTHWTYFGVSIVRERVLWQLKAQGLEIHGDVYGPDSFRLIRQQRGDLAEMLNLQGLHSFLGPELKADLKKNVERKPPVNNSLYARMEQTFSNRTKSLKLLVIGDSFIERFSELMSGDCGELLSVRLHDHQLRHLDPLVHYIESFKPDAVIEVRVGRMLLDTIPEDPPVINVDEYPLWLKKYFTIREQDDGVFN